MEKKLKNVWNLKKINILASMSILWSAVLHFASFLFCNALCKIKSICTILFHFTYKPKSNDFIFVFFLIRKFILWSQRSPWNPISHPRGYWPVRWWHCTPFKYKQFPHSREHFGPYVLFLQTILMNHIFKYILFRTF